MFKPYTARLRVTYEYDAHVIAVNEEDAEFQAINNIVQDLPIDEYEAEIIEMYRSLEADDQIE